jgi:hypothetical protein
MAADLIHSIRELFLRIGELSPEHGIADPELDAAETRLGLKIPAPLRQYYALAGNHKLGQAFNRFYAPDQIERRDGKAIFCEENQCVVYWGFTVDEADLDDPPVWQLNPDENEWYFECKRLSNFLLLSLYWQAVCDGLTASASGEISLEDFAWLESSFQRVEGQEVDDDYHLRAYIDEAIVVCAFPQPDNYLVYAGSNDEAKLEQFADRLGLNML